MTRQCFTRSASMVVAIGFALTATAFAGAGVYSVTDLGPMVNVAGREDSRPNAITNTRQIAGSDAATGAYRAVCYDGAWTSLGTLGGGESLGAGMNESGQVVGYSQNSSGLNRGFLWTPGGTDGVPGNPPMKALGTFGGLESAAFDINACGQIAGYAQTSANDDHAFLLTGGIMMDLGSLLPRSLPHSYAFSLNDDGQVVGTAYNSNWRNWHAFFFDGMTAVDLGTFGGQSSSALAINNGGHIVGYYTTDAGHDRAFRYFEGGMTDLGTLGGHYSYANGINNSNMIVGGSFVDSANTVFRAFLSNGDSMVDLNTLVDASGVGWTLVEARAINDAGEIVGTGTYGGLTRGFLLSRSAPRITGIQLLGTSVLLSFTTAFGSHYAVECRTTLVTGAWSDLVTGIAGNGGIVTITNSGGATSPGCFYRVRLGSL